MVRNPEKKMTRKIRKNRQTRRKRVLKMKTKMRKNRMHKTMKGGSWIRLTNLREQLKPTGDLGKQINLHLNGIVEFIGMKLEPGNPFITSYNAAPKLKASDAFTPVAPAAGTKQTVQFIPDNFIGEIPDTIQVLINEIKKQYRELCRSSSSSSPCGNSNSPYKLTPDKFVRVLDYVCKGEVHRTLCVGEVCRNFIPRSKDIYVKLKVSLSNIVPTPNPPPSDYSTSTPSSEGRTLDFTIILNKDYNPNSVFGSVFRIYVELFNLLKEELLKPNSINCKACIIVMPPFRKYPALQGHGQLMSPVTYGYSSFINQQLFHWVDLKKGERLEPNSYCASRKFKRAMANDNTLLRLNYTMSPLVIPDGLLPRQSLKYNGQTNYDVQLQHNLLLQTMTEILVTNLNPQGNPTDELIQKKEKLQTDFVKNGKVEMTHISYKDGLYYYYELKIQKTAIPVKNTVNPDTKINAVIIEFKAFSEDGICSKEIIFVSYERHSNAIRLLPGAISDDTNSFQVSPDTMNSAIHELFVNKFLELDRSLYYQVKPDKTVLDLIGNDGKLASRSSQISTRPTTLQPGVAYSDGSATSDICTIILENNDSKFSWYIALATDIQKGAFTAVNEHITEKVGWTLERGQTIFPVDNRTTGNQEIKVTVRVLTVDKDQPNRLLSATYQAQDSVPYLLFANRAVAEQYIRSRTMI